MLPVSPPVSNYQYNYYLAVGYSTGTWYYAPNNPLLGFTSRLFFSFPSIFFALFLRLPPFRNSDPGSHSRHSSCLSAALRSFGFCREMKSQAFSCLGDSRRIVTLLIGAFCVNFCTRKTDLRNRP